jgi:hypothetical protein
MNVNPKIYSKLARKLTMQDVQNNLEEYVLAWSSKRPLPQMEILSITPPVETDLAQRTATSRGSIHAHDAAQNGKVVPIHRKRA